jgi:hypothetical protein
MKWHLRIQQITITWTISLLFTGCSWESHLQNFQAAEPLNGSIMESHTIVNDSINSPFGRCLRQRYLRLPDSALYYVDCDCPAGQELDTIIGENDKLIWTRINQLASKNPSYLYSSMVYVFYDKQGRPMKQTTNIYEPDTNYQFQQYFNQEGVLLEKKELYLDELQLVHKK